MCVGPCKPTRSAVLDSFAKDERVNDRGKREKRTMSRPRRERTPFAGSPHTFEAQTATAGIPPSAGRRRRLLSTLEKCHPAARRPVRAQIRCSHGRHVRQREPGRGRRRGAEIRTVDAAACVPLSRPSAQPRSIPGSPGVVRPRSGGP